MTSHTAREHPAEIGALMKDPVCGMVVDKASTAKSAEHDGETFHFCSEHCRSRFVADPAAYSTRQGAAPSSSGASHADVEGVEYTCPMHPEVRQFGPGACPICGMALEPVMVTADTGPSPELVDMTRRFWVALVLALPVVVLEMGGDLFSAMNDVVSPTVSTWVQLVLSTPVVLWAGWPFFVRGWISVRTMRLNMFTLIAMGTGVAWLFSVVATVAPGIFPAAFQHMGTVDVYFEPAAVITVLVLLGQVLELRANKTS